MSATRSGKLSGAFLFLFFLWMLPGEMYAQENIDRNGLFLGGSAGYGQADVNTDNISRGSYGSFAFGLKGGYAIASRAILGLEFNGWTLTAFSTEDPSKGESVSNISLYFAFFPVNTLPIYISGGGGRLSYTNNSPEVNGRDKGSSWFIGSGYEIPITKNLMWVPQIRYSQGNISGGNFRVYELALGLHWYSGKISFTAVE